MFLQSNWICKATVNIRCRMPNNVMEDRVPSGRLRCITMQSLAGGTAALAVYFRVEGWDVTPDELFPVAIGGRTDWMEVIPQNALQYQGAFLLDLKSQGSIDVFWRGNNSSNHALQLGFWYEPEDGDDDSHLAPLSVGRGGETRT